MYTFNENFFETIDSEEKAYWLGFIAADGCLYQKRFQLSLVLAEKDLEHLIKFKTILDSEKSLSKSYHKRYICYSYKLSLSSFKMYNDLVNKGITPRKSLTLKPPLNVPDGLIRHWIRGYFDGDGYVGIRKGRNYIRFNLVGTKEILEFILKESQLNLNVKNRRDTKIFVVEGSNNKAIKFLTYLYENSNIYLDRKFNYYVINRSN